MEERVHTTRLAAAAALLILAACDTAQPSLPAQALDPALIAESAPLPGAGAPGVAPPTTSTLGSTGSTTYPVASAPPDPQRASPRADARSAVSTPPSRRSGTSDRADHP